MLISKNLLILIFLLVRYIMFIIKYDISFFIN